MCMIADLCKRDKETPSSQSLSPPPARRHKSAVSTHPRHRRNSLEPDTLSTRDQSRRRLQHGEKIPHRDPSRRRSQYEDSPQRDRTRRRKEDGGTDSSATRTRNDRARSQKRISTQGVVDDPQAPTRARSTRYRNGSRERMYARSDRDEDDMKRRHTLSERSAEESRPGRRKSQRLSRSRSVTEGSSHARRRRRRQERDDLSVDDLTDEDEDQMYVASESEASVPLGAKRPVKLQRSLSSHRRERERKARTMSGSSGSRGEFSARERERLRRRSAVDVIKEDKNAKVRSGKRRSGYEVKEPPAEAVRQPMVADVISLETVNQLANMAPEFPGVPVGRKEPKGVYGEPPGGEAGGGNQDESNSDLRVAVSSSLNKHIAAADISIPPLALQSLIKHAFTEGPKLAADLRLPPAAVPDLAVLALYDLLILCDDTSPPNFTSILTSTHHLTALHSRLSRGGASLRFYAHPADHTYNNLTSSRQLSACTKHITPVRAPGDGLWLGHAVLNKVLANRKRAPKSPAPITPPPTDSSTTQPEQQPFTKPLLVVVLLSGRLVEADGGLWRDLVKASWGLWGRGVRWCIMGIGKEGRRAARSAMEDVGSGGQGLVWAPRRGVEKILDEQEGRGGVGGVNAWFLQSLMEALRV